jgi:hypothetical protein
MVMFATPPPHHSDEPAVLATDVPTALRFLHPLRLFYTCSTMHSGGNPSGNLRSTGPIFLHLSFYTFLQIQAHGG